MSDSYNSLGVCIIGCKVLTYGHFDCYEIGDADGQPYTDDMAKRNINEFTLEICKFYNDEKRINLSYGDDLAEQNRVKCFILNKIKRDVDTYYKEGIKWINDFLS